MVELSGMRVVWVRQVGGWRRGGEMGMVVLGAGMGWDGEVGVKVGLKGKGWEGKRWVGSGNGREGRGGHETKKWEGGKVRAQCHVSFAILYQAFVFSSPSAYI